MALATMKITDNSRVSVNQKIVVAILLEQSLDGELIKNLVSANNSLINNFF